jgi:hypothetical protein
MTSCIVLHPYLDKDNGEDAERNQKANDMAVSPRILGSPYCNARRRHKAAGIMTMHPMTLNCFSPLKEAGGESLLNFFLVN